MKLTFLGTNGWYSSETGNTACVFLDTEEYYIVFDAGDGLQKLDKHITEEKPIYLFLSHFHLDHIYGLHLLSKFRFKQGIKIYGQKGTRKILGNLIQHPFTVALKELPIHIEINELSEGSHQVPFPISCKFLIHADPCLGYRITIDGKIITYCTDTGICDNSLELSRNTDILIHECGTKAGFYLEKWPHTNPQEAATLAKKANARKLFLFHFNPMIHISIADRKQAEAEAREIFKNTTAAMDGASPDI